jgi:uncharacterized protein
MFAVYLVIVTLFHGGLTGEWAPTGGVRSLWYLSVIGLLAFRLLSAPLFVKPADAIASSIAAVFMLWSADVASLIAVLPWVQTFRWASVGVLGVVVVAGVMANTWKDAGVSEQPRRFVARAVGYRFSAALGVGEVVFTPVAVLSVVSHGQQSLGVASALIVVWVIIAVVAPLRTDLAGNKRDTVGEGTGRDYSVLRPHIAN